MLIARKIQIKGHVQGVFFREWTVRIANEIGVSGWVRNRSDGSVEAYASGEPEQIERFVTELRNGSPASQVANVDVEAAELEQVAGFMRRATF